ncbi:hypothetical protein OOT33_15620 [Sphingobium sp. DEHP117]|uniref:hypothetical protein n=1 Tax=Sphingobium sp. DEHP117 TaxID=2993436 RepID=UPI0027D50665|nr:hypothetical protein [Sphingobium sp. DEHP117]MDQ4421850.1 hypothetical protein [Sphingobium sp. DEHP117]
MNQKIVGRGAARLCLTGTLAALAACATKPVAPPPPAPPPMVLIPPRPLPPLGAAPNLAVPPLAPDGTRLTINYGVSGGQALWNLRSAYNVAALSCQKPVHQPIAAQYAAFLKSNKKLLATVYKDLDKQFKKEQGADYIRKREIFQTQVYNYFSLPPVLPALCDTMLALGPPLGTVPSKELEARSVLELARIEKLYLDFFNSYDQYRTALSAWEARYGAQATVAPAAIPVASSTP